MLIRPEGNAPLRVISIDPGTETLGIVGWLFDLEAMRATVIGGETWVASKQLKHVGHYQYIEQTFGARQARIASHHDRLLDYCHLFQPHLVVSESPFIGQMSDAFAALVECLNSLRWAVWQYDSTVGFNTVTPQQAKMAVGAAGSKEKDAVRNGVINAINDPSIAMDSQIDIMSLDEHAIDAVAVGYFAFRYWIENN